MFHPFSASLSVVHSYVLLTMNETSLVTFYSHDSDLISSLAHGWSNINPSLGAPALKLCFTCLPMQLFSWVQRGCWCSQELQSGQQYLAALRCCFFFSSCRALPHMAILASAMAETRPLTFIETSASVMPDLQRDRFCFVSDWKLRWLVRKGKYKKSVWQPIRVTGYLPLS